MDRSNAPLLIQRAVAALLAFCILFATVVRVPGAMLSSHEGALTYEICTGDGVQIVLAPSNDSPTENAPTDTGCEFFAAQIAALLKSAPDLPVYEAVYVRTVRPAIAGVFTDRGAAAHYLIRGPPFRS